MGYSFTIGRLGYARREYFDGRACSWEFVQVPAVFECEGNPSDIHTDALEGVPGPCRCPSYYNWNVALNALPQFKYAFGSMREYVEHVRTYHRMSPAGIPCMYYQGLLDSVEGEAIASKSANSAPRALWFVRWSREAIRRYGEMAMFETPGEW
jgi:hypothetical protein